MVTSRRKKMIFHLHTSTLPSMVIFGFLGEIDYMKAKVQPRKLTVEATVIRADGTKEDLGVIAGWERNVFKRALMRIRYKGRITWQR